MNSNEVMEKIEVLNSRVAALEGAQRVSRRLFTHETAALMRDSITKGNYEEVDVLLRSGFDPSYPVTPVSPSQDRWNVYLFFVQAGRHQAVEYLLSSGQVSVDYKDADGFCALQIAAERGDLEMVKLLLRYSASFDTKQFSALHLATSSHRVEVAALLLAEASRRRDANL